MQFVEMLAMPVGSGYILALYRLILIFFIDRTDNRP